MAVVRIFPYSRGLGSVQRLPIPLRPDPPGNVFYVNNAGSDANPGTKAAPWQTLAHASSARTYGPNDTIALAGNNTFTNDPFTPLGNGTYDGATFASVYASTLSAQQAIYVAGPQYNFAYNICIADGDSTTTAAATATEYCRRLAMRDAIRAGHGAALSSSSWVRITRYGEGANPLVNGAGSLNAGLVFDPATFVGGWMIDGVDFTNCLCAGAYCQPSSPSSGAAGLYIFNSNATGITGMPLPPGGGDNNPRVPGFFNAWAVPYGTNGVSNVYVQNCSWSGCDAGLFFWQGSYLWMTQNVAGVSKYQPCWLIGNTGVPAQWVQNSLVELLTISRQAVQGWPNGTAGFSMAAIANVFFENVGVATTTTSKDGVAWDLESNCNNLTWRLCQMTDNQGTGAGVFSGAGTGLSIWDSNTFYLNGLQNLSQTPAIMKITGFSTPNDPALFMNNQITRAGSGTTQKLFADDANPPTIFQDTPPTGYRFGSDNLVTPP